MKTRMENEICQHNTVDIEVVLNNNIIIPSNAPRMILIAGPCRVGTTALSNVFARAGLPAYMQPIKSIRRAAMDEGNTSITWNINDSNGDFVVSKETFGPLNLSEFFNPIDILLDRGYPREKLFFIPIIREPFATLTSWIRMWGEASIDKFVEAYKLTAAIERSSRKKGISIIPYVHDVIRGNDSKDVVRKLFERIELGHLYSDKTVDWTSGPVFGETDSRAMFFDNPPYRFVKGVKEWGAYKFKLLKPDLDLSQIKALEIGGIPEIYKRFCKLCETGFECTI